MGGCGPGVGVVVEVGVLDGEGMFVVVEGLAVVEVDRRLSQVAR